MLQALTSVIVPANSTAVPETLTAAAPITLSASTTYWFVLHDTPQALTWRADTGDSGKGTVPTTASGYTYLGYEASSNGLSGPWSADTNNYAVQIAVAVPEPSAGILMGLAFGGIAVCTWMRRRRCVSASVIAN